MTTPTHHADDAHRRRYTIVHLSGQPTVDGYPDVESVDASDIPPECGPTRESVKGGYAIVYALDGDQPDVPHDWMLVEECRTHLRKYSDVWQEDGPI